MATLKDLMAMMQSSKPKPTPTLGTGMAQQTMQTIQSRPYQLHMQEMQALGQPAMSLEEFMKSQGGKGLLAP